LQFRDSLSQESARWRDLLDFPAEASEAFGQFRDLTTTNAARFYRVISP
jgi:hypothetical protein